MIHFLQELSTGIFLRLIAGIIAVLLFVVIVGGTIYALTGVFIFEGVLTSMGI